MLLKDLIISAIERERDKKEELCQGDEVSSNLI